MASLAILSSGALLVSCDWSSGGGDGFNTSRQNLNVNLSGVYRGELAGGKAVANPSGGDITQLIMSQSGNVLEVSDNQGSTYRGRAGTPFVSGAGDDTTIPAGTELASYIVAFEGVDQVANRNIRFTGNIELIAVTDVDGQDTFSGTSDSRQTSVVNTSAQGVNNTVTTTSGTSSQNDTEDTRETMIDNQSTTESISVTGGTQVGNFGEVETDMTTTTTVNTLTDAPSTTTTSSSGSNNSVVNMSVQTDSTNTSTTDTPTTLSNNTSTGSRTFNINSSTFQHRLRGSWIEEGGTVSEVNARAASAGGVFTVPIGSNNITGGFGGGTGLGTTGGSTAPTTIPTATTN